MNSDNRHSWVIGACNLEHMYTLPEVRKQSNAPYPADQGVPYAGAFKDRG